MNVTATNWYPEAVVAQLRRLLMTSHLVSTKQCIATHFAITSCLVDRWCG